MQNRNLHHRSSDHSSASSSEASWDNPQAQVGIVGAGPVGSLLSIYLAKRGISSTLYERRPDIRQTEISAGRSINLAVSKRGLYALHEIGMEEEILKQAVPMRGRMIHSVSGALTFQRYGMNDSECIHSISRGGLNKTLMTFAEKTGKVQIQFNHRALDLQLEAGELKVENTQTHAVSSIRHQTVIATDGSASAIRDSLIRQTEMQCTQDVLEYGYKELTIPAGPGGQFLLERNALHIWPRGHFMLIALPNFDGSFTCTLFLPFRGPQSFEKLEGSSAKTSVTVFFTEYFQDTLTLIPRLEEAFHANPTGHMTTIRCSPWHASDRALLLGDAAHAIVPFFGQGMNCGFEDCTLLNGLLETNGAQPEWEKVFSKFSTSRKPHSDGIAEMALENFSEMRDKVGNPRFLMEKEAEKLLQKKFQGDYISRYSLVSFSRIPYQAAYQAGLIQNEILTELCRNLDQPDQIDLDKAEELIRTKLNPILSPYKGENYGL